MPLPLWVGHRARVDVAGARRQQAATSLQVMQWDVERRVVEVESERLVTQVIERELAGLPGGGGDAIPDQVWFIPVDAELCGWHGHLPGAPVGDGGYRRDLEFDLFDPRGIAGFVWLV
jgi:hypothetical protein